MKKKEEECMSNKERHYKPSSDVLQRLGAHERRQAGGRTAGGAGGGGLQGGGCRPGPSSCCSPDACNSSVGQQDAPKNSFQKCFTKLCIFPARGRSSRAAFSLGDRVCQAGAADGEQRSGPRHAPHFVYMLDADGLQLRRARLDDKIHK